MKIWSILIVIVLFFCQIIFAQSAFAEQILQIETAEMGFYDAVNFALNNNNNIRAMRKNLSATERDIGIARSDLMPKVRFHENFTVTNNPIEAFSFKLNQTRATTADLAIGTLDFPGAVTNFLTSGVIEQPIYNRKAMIGIKMARKEYSANGYIFLRQQEELVNQVALAFLGVSSSQDYIKVAELAIKDAKEHLDIAESRTKSKSTPNPDVLRAKTSIDEANQKLVTAQRNLNVAKMNLGLQLGLEKPVKALDSVPEFELHDLNYYKELSVYRNDIKATEIRVQNAKNNIQSARSDWYPTLNAIASYNLYNSNYSFGAQGSNYIAGALFRWDVFDGKKRNYEILKAKDKEAEAKEYLEGFKKEVNFRVYEVYSSVEESQKKLEIALAARKLAYEDKTIVSRRWQSSLSPFIDLIDAQSNLDSMRENVVKSQNDLKVSLVKLYFESGIDIIQ